MFVAEESKLYQCIISPGIAEVCSNVKDIPGFFPVDFKKHQDLELTSPSAVRVLFQVKDLPPRQSYKNLGFGRVYGEPQGDLLHREYNLFPCMKARIEIGGLSVSPTITVNRPYHRFGKLRIGDFCPSGIHLRDVLLAKLISAEYLPLHGSAFAAAGDGVLVTGLPGTGKTQIVLQAIKEGFQYLSDDLTIADGSGRLRACHGVSSFAYEMNKVPGFQRYRQATYWKNKLAGFLSRGIPLAGSLFEQPYLDVSLFAQHVEFVQEAKARYIFILAKGSSRVERLSNQEALNMLVTVNRLEFSYPGNPLLLAHSLLNPRLDLSELMRTEERLLQKLVEGATCFLCVASNPEEYYGLIKQSI